MAKRLALALWGFIGVGILIAIVLACLPESLRDRIIPYLTHCSALGAGIAAWIVGPSKSNEREECKQNAFTKMRAIPGGKVIAAVLFGVFIVIVFIVGGLT